MMANGIHPLSQSTYRQYHCTETALLRVMNDILLKMNSQHVTLLVLLDLSAAFDTVSHDVLLDRLHNDVGLRGNALNWFYSIFLKEVSESIYMVLCQIISTWTVVFHKALTLDLYYWQFTRLSYIYCHKETSS